MPPRPNLRPPLSLPLRLSNPTSPPRRPLHSPLPLPPLPLPQPPLPPQSRQFTSPPPLQFLTSLLPSLPPLPKSPLTTLTATKTLPYPPHQIYHLISDINSYRHFLPHCTHSLITSHTPTTSLPLTADLTVGWGPLTQSYTSRVYCIPCTTVEAVSGNATPTIPPHVLQQHGYHDDVTEGGKGGKGDKKGGGGLEGGVFESLCTKWTVREVGKGTETGTETEVRLTVTFQFANPAVGLAVQGVADEMVGRMIAAFEGRAREVCGRPGGAQTGTVGG
ncbi:dehydrase and lipid transport-domain-containing protein [Cercophora samala]|uniref:Dehydrase and lipid transport-domain-containing protein n=1 Tax=Cercophora samala TaxID=330535 RepID=A0AA39ZGV4_9PEZI|nr:dehydrase and lipid transport-domain-containing protein [Cercophora samala]